MHSTLGFILALGILFGSAAAAPVTAESRTEPALVPGSKAPALKVAEWVKGDPVVEFKTGKVYVVQFWATWCSASRRAIPRLHNLQQKFEDDLRVIAVSAVDAEGESLSRVRRAVQAGGRRINYAVAFDDRRHTTRAWMDAAEERTIPTAFVVDRSGTVVWIGNPLWPSGEFEDAVAKAIAGEFGPAERAAAKDHWRRVQEQLAELEKLVPQAIMDGDRAQVTALLDRMSTLNPAGASGYVTLKIQTLLGPGLNPAAAYEEARKALKGPLKDDSENLNAIAWAILDDPEIEPRDNDLAYEMASRAVELTNSADAAILDTFALACARRGQLGKAIELQARAVDVEEDSYERAAYAEKLESYRAQRAARRSGTPQ